MVYFARIKTYAIIKVLLNINGIKDMEKNPMEDQEPISNLPQEDTTFSPTPEKQKNKDKKRKVIIISAIILVILLAAAGFAIYYLNQNNTDKSSNSSTTSSESSSISTEEISTDNASVNDTSNILIDASNEEATISDTNDDNIASDTQTAEDQIGGSIDENNL